MFPYGFEADDLLARFSEERLIEITDLVNRPPTTRDDVAIERAANEAAGELHKYAGRYYVTPIDPLPDWLRADLLDLWAFRLLFNCRPDWLENATERDGFSWGDRRKELLAWLEKLASPNRGAVLPGCAEIASGTSGVPSHRAWANSSPPRMTRENLERCP